MPVSDESRKLVEGLFRAMHDRQDGEARMAALFADDAEVTEPFSGQPTTHRGKGAIMAWFRQAVENMPPDMQIKMDRLDMDGDRVRADWTCTASAFPSPMKGHDLYVIRDGKIVRAEFVVTEMPPMEQPGG